MRRLFSGAAATLALTKRRAASLVMRHAKTTPPSAHKGRTLITLLMMLLTTTTAWAEDVAVTTVSDFGTKTDGTTTQSGYYTLTSGNTYMLQNDVNIDGYLYIPSGTTVTIDLNGHTLDRGLDQEHAIKSGYVIDVKGSLTLNDSQGGGTVTGGCPKGFGAGMYVYGADATFTMNGGCITGNQQASNNTSSGGGVSVRGNATFIMNGGSITNNTTTKNGGGVFVEFGTFTMNGGTISGNKCPSNYNGAGVYVYESDNKHATFNVSGSAIVTGNTKATSTTDNVYLSDNTIINVTGALTTSANIGVRMATIGTFAKGSGYTLTASDADRFSSDVSGYAPLYDSGTGIVILSAQKAALLSVLTWNSMGYFEIANEQDLIDLGDFTASNAANNCEGLTFKLTADLDFTHMPTRSKNDNSGNFHPIGLVEDASFNGCFSGHFDGQNHAIKALRYTNTIGLDPNNNAPVGLFKRVDGSSAVVERVFLIDPQMSGKASGCGGIAGVIRNGATIRNCTVLGGSITRTGDGKSGGIVGSNTNNAATIEGCTVIGTSVRDGIIIGFANSEQTIKDCIYYAPDGHDIAGGSYYTDGGGNQRVYLLTLGEGITATSTPTYSTALLPGKAYYANGTAVTLSHGDRTGYDFGYESTGVTITEGAFTMPDNDVTVSAAWTPSENVALTANEADGNCWTTFYCGDAGYDITTADACAYTAKYTYDDSTNPATETLTLHKLGTAIAKGEAVIIVSKTSPVSLTKGADGEKSATNDLHGVDVRTLTSTLGTGTFYVMGKKGGDIGFFEYTGDYMPARKAYLLINGSHEALARGLTMVFADDNGSAGVSPATVADGDVRAPGWYTLDGRRLEGKPKAKGIFIYNGRKEVLK